MIALALITDDDRRQAVELTRTLISVESHAEAVGHESSVGRFLKDWFDARGIAASLQSVVGERSNVVARIPGGDGPSLMLNGHLDTVPAGEMSDAFAATIDGAVLRGRGACDMKGAVAAMCVTMAAVARAGTPLSGDLVFAGTIDEESGSLGVKALLDAGIRADYALVGEPTSLRIAVTHKGSCFVRIVLRGRGAHGSVPQEGVNAVVAGARLVSLLEGAYREKLAGRTHPLLGTATVNVGRLCGGTQPNIVAESCELEIDRRLVPGEAGTVEEIRALVASICDPIAGLSYEVTEMPMTAVVPHVPLETPPAGSLVAAARDACTTLGLPDDPIGVTYWSDGGHLSARGVETVVLGPGTIAHAHGPDDHVAIDDLHRAVELYTHIAHRLLAA
ncbi:MAG: M20/M25/M40 family metallo-hydrolase [Candidatus Bipolaricaulota bacterium]|nr:MAG: M20/M25/M40 family metallo-hydrolase [Candidatus Bipolaricaulota bacterium]